MTNGSTCVRSALWDRPDAAAANSQTRRLLRAVDDARACAGLAPVFVQVAPDVMQALRDEQRGVRWPLVWFDANAPVVLYAGRCGTIPVRESRRLVPGSIVPILPLQPEA